MPIERYGEFLETSDLGITHSLGIESHIIDRCISEVRRRSIKGVFGCPMFGFKQEDMDFMTSIPLVEQLWFWEVALKNIDGIYSLERLKYFGIQDKRPSIDFSKFLDLEYACWTPVKNDSGMNELNKLKHIDLWKFKPKDKSFASLHLPESLLKIEVNWSNPIDLEAFPVLPHLKEVQFHYCRNLKSIRKIRDFAPNLEKLVITRCPNLEDYESVCDLSLSHLYINIKGKQVC